MLQKAPILSCFDYFGAQIQGSRNNQQDYYAFVPPEDFQNKGMLCILADGMGGYEGGEIASSTAVHAFAEFFLQQENPGIGDLQQAIHNANEHVAQAKTETEALESMGTTICAVYIQGNTLSLTSVGDSLIFLYRNGSLRLLNKLHSVGAERQEQLNHSLITQAEYDQTENKHCLTAALTGDVIEHIDLQDNIAIYPHDIVLLCSDGILSLDQQGIIDIFSKAGVGWTAQVLVQMLLNQIVKIKPTSQDNTTVALIKIKEIDLESNDDCVTRRIVNK